MNQKLTEKIKKLLKLADVAQEFEFVDVKLVDAWCSLREELGLAKLLLLIEEYVTTKTIQSQAQTITPETSNTNQDTNVVQ